MPDTAVLAAQPAPTCFLPIVYEDTELLVLHKTSGVPSLPHSPEETQTAVNAALARDADLSGVGRSRLEAGLLHRLDTGTSGLLAFARTSESFDRLRAAWKTRAVEKTYRALCQSSDPSAPALRCGQRLERPIGRSAKSSRRMLVHPNHPPQASLPPGRRGPKIRGPWLPAVTRVLAVSDLGDGLADLTIVIETGVMHQIRAHLADAGWPILGDPIYGADRSQTERLWLHAWKLALPMAQDSSLRLVARLPHGWPAAVP